MDTRIHDVPVGLVLFLLTMAGVVSAYVVLSA